MVHLVGGLVWRTFVANFGGGFWLYEFWWTSVVAFGGGSGIVDFGLGLGRRTFVLGFGGGLWARFPGGLPW